MSRTGGGSLMATPSRAGWPPAGAQLVLLAPLAVVAVAADVIHTVGAFAASTAPVLVKVRGHDLGERLGGGRRRCLAAAPWSTAGRPDPAAGRHVLGLRWRLPDVGALASSELASTLDPALSRATIALTLGLGLGMAAVSLLDQRTARPTTRPRGKAA